MIPAAGYRIIQKTTDDPPIVIDRELAIHTSEQIKAHMLCGQCEARFSKNGESWVLQHCFRTGSGFRLKELLDAEKPVGGNEVKIYSAEGIPQIDVTRLTYFAASVIWRRSAHNWKLLKKPIENLSLGPYEEELRQYLLGLSPFPQNAVLWVTVNPNDRHWELISIPYGGRHDGFWMYRFQFLGINFTFFLGKLIDSVTRMGCTFRSVQNFMYVGDENRILRDFGPMVSRSRLVNPR